MEINEIEAVEPIEEPAGITREGKLRLAFALIVLVASYVFVSIVPIVQNALGFFVLSAVFYVLTAVFALLTGGRLSLFSVCAFVFGLVFSFYRFGMNGSMDILSGDLYPAFFLSGLAYVFFVVSLYDNHSRTLGGRFLLDLWKGFSYLFVSFGEFFTDLFKPKGAKKGSTNVLFAVIGIFVAVILLIIVGSLLSYDDNFAAMLPDFDIDDIAEYITRLILTVPVAGMIYSVYASSKANKLSKLSSEENMLRSAEKMKFIPAMLVILPVCALLIMYVMFFVSQWAYYVGAFTHKLPEAYSYAEYARKGFFELCAVAGINSALIIALSCFTKWEGKTGGVLKALIVLLSAATLILIATAISKMALYIDAYDLTRDRLIATLILVFLTLAFIIVILFVFIKKMKALPIIIGVGLVMLLCFSLTNSDRLIAKYNVDSYLSGKHSSIDLEYLSGLEYNGVPELKRLYENAGDEIVKNKAKEYLVNAKRDISEEDAKWYNICIPYLTAKKALAGFRP
jgi:hypothetical protein